MNGGAEAVAPLVGRLRMQEHEVRVLSYAAATSSFASMKVAPDRVLDEISFTTCRSEVDHFDPHVVVTGTQFQDKEHPITLEQQLWKMAGERGIKSIAVLDTWGNYLQRFSDLDERGGIVGKLTHLPAAIAVMDKYAKESMARLGFPRGIIAVTGNPYFNRVNLEMANLPRTTRVEVLAKPVFTNAGFDPKKMTIVFFSDSWADCPNIGFTEKSVLQSFLRIANEVAEKIGKINVIVRPHPFRNRDAAEAFDIETPNLAKVLHNPITARGSNPENTYSMEQLLASVNLAVGTFNNPLVTARIARVPAVHWVPGYSILGTNGQDLYSFLHRRDITSKITDRATLMGAIIGLADGIVLQNPMPNVAGAIDAVIRLVEQ